MLMQNQEALVGMHPIWRVRDDCHAEELLSFKSRKPMGRVINPADKEDFHSVPVAEMENRNLYVDEEESGKWGYELLGPDTGKPDRINNLGFHNKPSVTSNVHELFQADNEKKKGRDRRHKNEQGYVKQSNGWVLGHLLNASWDGSGHDWNNLTFLTTKTNNLHKGIEGKVTQFLKMANSKDRLSQLETWFGVQYLIFRSEENLGVTELLKHAPKYIYVRVRFVKLKKPDYRTQPEEWKKSKIDWFASEYVEPATDGDLAIFQGMKPYGPSEANKEYIKKCGISEQAYWYPGRENQSEVVSDNQMQTTEFTANEFYQNYDDLEDLYDPNWEPNDNEMSDSDSDSDSDSGSDSDSDSSDNDKMDDSDTEDDEEIDDDFDFPLVDIGTNKFNVDIRIENVLRLVDDNYSDSDSNSDSDSDSDSNSDSDSSDNENMDDSDSDADKMHQDDHDSTDEEEEELSDDEDEDYKPDDDDHDMGGNNLNTKH